MKLISWLLFLLPCYVIAATTAQVIPPYNMHTFDQVIQKLYNSVPKSQSPDINKRIAADSAFFLGKPYKIGALGEGFRAKFDKSPLYRTDKFDCVTFVSTVLALAEATNLKQFQVNIKKIRYKNSKVTYLKRNHFMSVDWNKNNSKNGYVQDITAQVVDKNGHSIAKVATAIIDKPKWYQILKAGSIKYFQPLAPAQTKKLLDELHQLSQQTQPEKSAMLYMPLNKLFVHGKPNMDLFRQIPSGSIIEIVRPNWDLSDLIGTHLNVSHLGLAIRTSQGLMFREASSVQGKIIDVPLTDYLKDCLKSPTIKGINVRKIILE